MRYLVLTSLLVLALIGIGLFLNANKTPSTENEASNTTRDTNSTAQERSDAQPTQSETPGAEESAQSQLDAALAGAGSVRCTWVDARSGDDGLALIQNGNLYIEQNNDQVIQNVLYTSAATYLWKTGSTTGIAIPKNFTPDASVSEYAFETRSALETRIRTNERVSCDEQQLNSNHFTPPQDIDFSLVGSFSSTQER